MNALDKDTIVRALEDYLNGGGSPIHENEEGRTLFHLAASAGIEEAIDLVAQAIIPSGIECLSTVLNKEDENGNTALFYAADLQQSRAFDALLWYSLFSKEEKKLSAITYDTAHPMPILHFFVEQGNLEEIDALVLRILQSGTSQSLDYAFRMRDLSGKTALFYASDTSTVCRIQTWMRDKAVYMNPDKQKWQQYLEATDDQGRTAWSYANQRGDTELAKTLYTQNQFFLSTLHGVILDLENLIDTVDINTLYDEDGELPIHVAAWGGRVDTAEFLLDEGADVNATSQHEGSTALMIAAQCGQGEFVDLLLRRGANPNLRDASGETAASYAQIAGNPELAERLIPRPAPAA